MFSGDLRLVTCTCDLQVELLYTISYSYFSRSFVKSNTYRIVYKCGATLVTTSEDGHLLFVLITFFTKIVSPRFVRATVRLVNYACRTFTELDL